MKVRFLPRMERDKARASTVRIGGLLLYPQYCTVQKRKMGRVRPVKGETVYGLGIVNIEYYATTIISSHCGRPHRRLRKKF